jgi:hypothetical protein
MRMNHRSILRIGLVSVVVIVVLGLLYKSNYKQSSRVNKDTQTILDFENKLQGSIQVARWIFENHQCDNCHTLSKGGYLGLTATGKKIGQDFQGCPGMLQTVSQTIHIPETKWSGHQRKVRNDFKSFGCNTCHQIGERQMTLTEVGAKAEILHMSCSGVMSTLKSGK